MHAYMCKRGTMINSIKQFNITAFKDFTTAPVFKGSQRKWVKQF